MIQPNELRIGNWVSHNSEWSYRNDGVLMKKPFNFPWEESDWYAVGECMLSLDNISTIPLTPSILKRNGFDEDEIIFGKTFTNGELLIYVVSDGYAAQIGNSFKYVHQLQNLYFALTQTELKIQL